jgi:hypothetical protein
MSSFCLIGRLQFGHMTMPVVVVDEREPGGLAG